MIIHSSHGLVGTNDLMNDAEGWRSKVKAKVFSRVWLFVTPWTVGSSVHGILQARKLEWVAVPFSRDLPNPGIKPRSHEL